MNLVHDRFEHVISEHYERLRAEVLATVRGKLAADNLHPDPSDLDAAYNAAWHALYERSGRDRPDVSNLGGWLATIAYRRAIDEIRSARLKYRAPLAVGAAVSEPSYEHDVDSEIADRQRYHQWLMSIRLRLNDRERQAVSLCVLHEHSRRDASEIMGIDIKRLDKIMVGANKKLGGMLEAISRGDWCQDQRSLIKAYAFGLHEHGGERHTLAVAHLAQCQACAAYVRSVRGLTIVVPVPAVFAGAAGAGGGVLGALTALFNGGTGGGAAVSGATAAGGGGATLLGGIGVKTATLCVGAVCVAGGAVVIVQSAPRVKPPVSDRASSRPVAQSRSSTADASPVATARSAARRASGSSSGRAAPDPKSKGAQEIAELGIEPQATSTTVSSQQRAASVPRRADASEFGIGP